MKINNKNSLKKVNFSDYIVLETRVDKKSKMITFILTGASQMVNANRIDLGKGYLEIAEYDRINITAYNARENHEMESTEDNYEQLREISEIDVCENKLLIKGYAGLTDNWIEFDVLGGEASGEFTDLQFLFQ